MHLLAVFIGCVVATSEYGRVPLRPQEMVSWGRVKLGGTRVSLSGTNGHSITTSTISMISQSYHQQYRSIQ